jgi:peptide/nickel transport system permease protein
VAVAQVAQPAEAASETDSRVGRVWRSFVLRRVFKSLVTIYLVASASFFLTKYMPGDPVDAFVTSKVQQGYSQRDAIAQATSLLTYNPNEPLPKQYGHYIWRLLHGDMGQSIVSSGTPVTTYIKKYLPWTLFSVGLGTLIAFIIGVTIGVIIAYRRGGFLDHFMVNVSSFLHAVPNYVWAILILIIGGVELNLFSIDDVQGTYSPGVHPGFNYTFISDALYHAVLPVTVYAMTLVGGWILLMKSSTTQVLDEDFVTVAKARGLKDGRIRTMYVGRNAVLPLFSQFAIAIGFVVGGSTVVEQILKYQGVGYYFYTAITSRDYPVMQGFLLVLTISVIVANLIADLLLSRIDPRIRSEGGGL